MSGGFTLLNVFERVDVEVVVGRCGGKGRRLFSERDLDWQLYDSAQIKLYVERI